MIEIKRYAPLFAAIALGAVVAACDEAPREQQSEVPPAMEQVPDTQPQAQPAPDSTQPQDPAAPKE